MAISSTLLTYSKSVQLKLRTNIAVTAFTLQTYCKFYKVGLTVNLEKLKIQWKIHQKPLKKVEKYQPEVEMSILHPKITTKSVQFMKYRENNELKEKKWAPSPI